MFMVTQGTNKMVYGKPRAEWFIETPGAIGLMVAVGPRG